MQTNRVSHQIMNGKVLVARHQLGNTGPVWLYCDFDCTVQQVFGFLTCTWGLSFPSGLQKVQISCCAASDLDLSLSGGNVVTVVWMARPFVEGYGSLEHRSQDVSRRQQCCWTPWETWPGSYQSACLVHVFPFSSDWSKDCCWAVPAKSTQYY